MNLDLSPQALFKYLLLMVMLVALLWVLGDVYRGEIQNKNIAIDIVGYDGNYGPNDVLFTRGTLDTRAERLPAKIIIEHRILIQQGDSVVTRTLRIARRSARLNMLTRQTDRLRNGQFAFPREVEAELKNRAEYLARLALRKYRSTPSQTLRRWLASKSWVEPHAHGATYLARIHFPSNPYFLLFQHPDREVKATGWLTLLTSLFALFAQFLFAQAPTADTRAPTEEIAASAQNSPSSVRRSAPAPIVAPRR